MEGAPKGYAVDEARGLLYTNLEDKNRTLVIDIKIGMGNHEYLDKYRSA